MLFSRFAKTRLVTPDEALPGRATRPYAVPATHAVLGTPLEGPWPAGLEVAYFALGCFWGAERVFWQTPGVYSTAVGYQGGATPHPTYDEVCSGMTGHTEAVQVVYDPAEVSYRALVSASWRRTTRPRATARATTPGRSTAPRCTGRPPTSRPPPRSWCAPTSRRSTPAGTAR